MYSSNPCCSRVNSTGFVYPLVLGLRTFPRHQIKLIWRDQDVIKLILGLRKTYRIPRIGKVFPWATLIVRN